MDTGICFVLLLFFIAVIWGGAHLLSVIIKAFSGPPAAQTPPRAEPDPRQAQEILQLRNHVARLEQRVVALESGLDLQKMRAKTALPPTEPVSNLDHDFDVDSLLAPKPQQPRTIPPVPPASAIKPTPIPTAAPTPAKPAPKPFEPAPTHFQNVPQPPVKAHPPAPVPPTPIPTAPPLTPAPQTASTAPTTSTTPALPIHPITPTTPILPSTPAPAAAQSSLPATPATPIPPLAPAPQVAPIAPAPTVPPIATTPTSAPIPTVMKSVPVQTPAPVSTPSPASGPQTPPPPFSPTPPPPAKPAPAPTAPEPKRAPITLESLLTMRLFVWIAGIVLSLAGILFMKYLNDKSVFPEWTRLALGAVIGLAALGAGEYFRKLYQRIAATIVGAGLTTLFAVVLAGTLNNPLITHPILSKPIAFVFLAAIALGAVGLSLRHGMLVAVLGLLGGYITPAILSTGEPKPVALALYLVFLQTGLILVIKKRGWMPLAALTLLATMVWAAAMVFMGQIGAQGLPIALLLISTGVQFSLVLDRSELGESAPESTQDPNHWVYRAMGLVAVVLGLFLLSTRVALGDFQVMDWGYLGLVSLALILLGRLKQGYSLLPYFGLLATSFLFIQWMRQSLPVDAAAAASQTAPSLILAGLSATFVLGAMLAAIKGPHPARFAALSALSAAAFAGIGYWFQERLNLHGMMPYIAILGTVVFTLAGTLVQAFTAPSRNKTLVMATYLVAASAFALAIAPFWFENWIAPAWAAQVLIMIVIARHFKIPFLHALAMPIALLAFARLTLAPDLLTQNHETLGLFNWILTNYFPVALLLGASAWTLATDPLLPEEGQSAPASNDIRWLLLAANILGSLSQILLGVMGTFLIRAAFIPQSSNLWANTAPVAAEWALWASLWLAMCLFATTLAHHMAWLKNNWLPALWMTIGLISSLLVATFYNPVLPGNTISLGSTPILNLLLVLYALPCLIAGFAAWAFHKQGQNQLHLLAVTIASVMGLLLVMLQVRHGFVGTPLYGLPVTLMQAGAYTLAGLITALAVRQGGRALGWDASSNIAGGYLLFTGLLFLIFQVAVANPLLNPENVSTTVFFNQILFAYALPAVILLAGAKLLAPFTDIMRFAGAMILAMAAALLIRHGYHPEHMGELKFLLTEAGTYTVVALTLAAALRQISQRLTWPHFDAVTGIYLALTALAFLFLQITGVNPVFSSGQVSAQVFLNAILYAYALPALMLLAAAPLLAPFTHIMRFAGAMILAMAATLLIRHGFHPEHMGELKFLLTEAGTYTIAALVLVAALRQLSLRLNWPHFDAVTYIYLGVATLGVLTLQGLGCNPVFVDNQVSTRIFFNAILWAFGLPAMLALCGSQYMPPAERFVRGAGLTGLFVTAILMVRHAFHPGNMTEPNVMMVEAAAYTITVKIVGILAMEWGIRKKDQDTAFIAQAFLNFSLAMAVLGQILFKNPLVSSESIGAIPIVNGLLVLYLIPAGLLVVQAWQCVRRDRLIRAKVNAVGALVMAVLFLSFEARWFFHDAGVLTLFKDGHLQLSFLESSTYAPLWLLLGSAIAYFGMTKAKPVLVQSGFALQAFSVGWVVFALMLLFNPILAQNSVGALYIFNGITAGFLLPAAILIASSAIYQRQKNALLTNMTVWTGHVLLFIGYSLTIRNFFQGEFLSAPGMGVAERYAYSAGWVLLAVAFLVVGIFTGKHRPRYASLAIMIIGVIKVGYDIFLLQDLYRIASLAGLGVGLLVMTFIYQKYVFKAQEQADEIA